MKLGIFRSFVAWVIVAVVVVGCGGKSNSVDFGDSSTGNLLWSAVHHGLVKDDPDKGIVFADKSIELYGDEAREQQASLSGFPATDPPEETFKYRALNDVGLAALVKGEILKRKGDAAGAKNAWSMVIEEFGYAQVQELGEWKDLPEGFPHDAQGFIKLADVAKLAITRLESGGD